MKIPISFVIAFALVCPACATEQRTYGTITAGPTKGLTPSPGSSAPAPEEKPQRPAPRRPAGGPLCRLFTTAEITSWLGLGVARGISSARDGYQSCTWRALDAPSVPSWRRGDPVLSTDDGIITITRGPARSYSDLEQQITTIAVAKGAAGRQELTGVGGSFSFAIGASVSGVPIWNAVALDGGAVVAVEVSGADSNSSLATVSEFLDETLARL